MDFIHSRPDLAIGGRRVLEQKNLKYLWSGVREDLWIAGVFKKN
ncbi:MAG TPA: hypothetical protein VK568_06960 [Thermodesulfobacteriota bacterium]|jgi:hypothetical protein|nr:hypothetical protein [Thermodesulfobacteriota bacterium]